MRSLGFTAFAGRGVLRPLNQNGLVVEVAEALNPKP